MEEITITLQPKDPIEMIRAIRDRMIEAEESVLRGEKRARWAYWSMIEKPTFTKDGHIRIRYTIEALRNDEWQLRYQQNLESR